ncbi:glycosyltransferase [Escherichia coli]|nr:glycosyltransferase [Escherichia coli]
MMKIVYVITGLSMGGAENQVCLLADQLTKLGHDVTLISLDNTLEVKPINDKVKLRQLSIKKNPISLIINYFKLRKIIKKISPDVVHSHLFHANIICRLLKLTMKIKKLISSSHSRYEGGVIRMLIYRVTQNLADIVTNVSLDASNELLKRRVVTENKLVTVFNGIDCNKFKFIPDSRQDVFNEFSFSRDIKLLLAVGRFTEAKDYKTLLNAFKILISKDDKFRLLVAGNGELFDSISTLKSQLNLDSFIYFLGVRDDIPRLMSAADIFVMSSAWEGLPLVIGEAMSCNCLIVTTNCGGVKEILGECGQIVPIRSPDLLAEKIMWTMETR